MAIMGKRVQVVSSFHVDWLGAVNDRVQAATGRLLLVDRTDLRRFLLNVVASLPTVHTPAERTILRHVLLDFAAQAGDTVHAREHPRGRVQTCRFAPALLLEPFWRSRIDDPATVFNAWLDAYCSALDEVHPLSVAQRAAQVLRRDYRRPWDITELARQVHSTASYLTRAFRHEYGRSIFDYQRDVRVFEALRRLREMKLEAVAQEVGYRSKKNLYALLNRAIGMNPADFRRLRADPPRQLIDGACLQLLEAPIRSHTGPVNAVRAEAADRKTNRRLRSEM